jgi:hypothetical protein
VAFYFLQDFVGGAYVFVFDVKNRVNEMLIFEGAKAVLARTGEERGVSEGCLAVEI